MLLLPLRSVRHAVSRDDDMTYTPRNILLTGGAGFIGSHVVAALAAHAEYKACKRPRPALATCLLFCR